MQRLRHIKQLGNVNLVYPSANHTRFEHSLGTRWIAQKIVRLSSQAFRDYRITKKKKEEIIMLSYDLAFERNKPSGSTKTLGLEALSPVIVNTICRNFSRGRANKLFRDSTIENPVGRVEISNIENNLRGDFYPKDCLKIGPSNNILTYHAIYFLNRVGRRANDQSLSYLLASHYLRVVCNLYKEKDNLKSNDINSEEEKHERISTLEADVKKIGKQVLKNVRNSVKSLLDDEAICEIRNTYHALGNVAKTPSGEAIFQPEEYMKKYSKTLDVIHRIHELTKKKYSVWSM